MVDVVFFGFCILFDVGKICCSNERVRQASSLISLLEDLR